MAYDPIDLGGAPNDGTGDTPRDAGTKINANFATLDTQMALKAPLASPTFTGTPAAPTAAPGANTTQLATTAFVTASVSTAVTGLLDLKSAVDLSANPDYPAASKGDTYLVGVAGKIGGASGKSADVGDVVIAIVDNAGGDEAAVGNGWIVLEHNLAGALLAANNLSDVANPTTARSNLGLTIGTHVQAYDADLSAIAALSPSDDDVVQRKAGAWVNRTIAQLRADLAAPRIIAASGAAVSLTGTGTETALATITIPANSMGANGQIVVEAYFSCASGGAPGNRDVRVRFGGNSVGTSTEFSLFRGGSTIQTMQIHARISNGNATNAQKSPATLNSNPGFGSSTNAKITMAYDTTADQYILITGDLTDAGDTIVLESYNVLLIRPD